MVTTRPVPPRTKTPPLYGLVLAGGKSRRMGKDKSRIFYHGKEQALYSYDLLSQFCEKIFISRRPRQPGKKEKDSHSEILDQKEFAGIGPLAGILSAMTAYPQTAWLVLACDLPLVDAQTLHDLIRKRNSQKFATAYANPENGLPEPLCAIYEPAMFPILKKFARKNIFCPRKILIHSDIKLLRLKNKAALTNINTLQEYREFSLSKESG